MDIDLTQDHGFRAEPVERNPLNILIIAQTWHHLRSPEGVGAWVCHRLITSILRLSHTIGAVWLCLGLFGGCGDVNKTPRDLMQEGIGKALPDDKLGATAVLRVEEAATDPLFRDVIVAMSDFAPFSVAMETKWTLKRGTSTHFVLKERSTVDVRDNVEFLGEVTKSLERHNFPAENTRKRALFTHGRFFTTDDADVWLEHSGLRTDAVQWRHEAVEPLSEILQLIDPWVTRTDLGTAAWRGLSARRIQLAPKPNNDGGSSVYETKRNQISEWGNWWRGHHSLVDLTGELVVLEDCNCIVSATLNVVFSIRKGAEEPFELRIEHSTSVDKLNNLSPPLPTQTTGSSRERISPMLHDVLGELHQSPAVD